MLPQRLDFTPGSARPNQFWPTPSRLVLPYQRSADFAEGLHQLGSKVKRLVGAPPAWHVLFFSCTGTALLETVVASLTGCNASVVVSNGYFGDRLADIAKHHCATVQTVTIPHTEPLNRSHESQIADAVNATGATLLLAAHVETSTGIINDIGVLSSIASHTHSLSVVDGISAIGSLDIDVAQLNVDAYIGVAYKCLMCPAACSFVIESEAYSAAATTQWSYALDMSRARRSSARGRHLWSPPSHSLIVLNAVLDHLLQSPADYFAVLQSKAGRFRTFLLDAGISILGPIDQLSPCFTAITTSGDSHELRDLLASTFNVHVGVGLGDDEDTILRCSQYPYATEEELERFARCIVQVLH